MSIHDDKRRSADPDDLPPVGAEAQAQRKATSMPLVWLVVGTALVTGFVAVLTHGGAGFHLPSAGPAPVKAAAPA